MIRDPNHKIALLNVAYDKIYIFLMAVDRKRIGILQNVLESEEKNFG
jgi:hypothetical protein